MIEKLASKEVQGFILANENADPFDLSLQYKEVFGIPIEHVAKQIAARKKAKSKLREWYNTKNIVYPPLISMEQCSSEYTAKNKAALIKGESLIDLTGGTGVDTLYLSKFFKTVFFVEQNTWLCEIAVHNFSQFGATNIQVINKKAEEFINTYDKTVDAIYIDPARRDVKTKKVFMWEDCEPNIIELQARLLQLTKNILVKASPMLDISSSIQTLETVSQVEVVSVKNECKEVLYLLSAEPSDQIEIITKNLIRTGELQTFKFSKKEESLSKASFSVPLTYLYEPNVSILKAGGFNAIGEAYNVKKLHKNTHLYTSEKLISEFPGRIFKITHITRYNKKAILRFLPSKKANVAVRNFPEDVASIRKKTALKPGGSVYIFGITDIENQKVILITEKAN